MLKHWYVEALTLKHCTLKYWYIVVLLKRLFGEMLFGEMLFGEMLDSSKEGLLVSQAMCSRSSVA